MQTSFFYSKTSDNFHYLHSLILSNFTYLSNIIRLVRKIIKINRLTADFVLCYGRSTWNGGWFDISNIDFVFASASVVSSVRHKRYLLLCPGGSYIDKWSQKSVSWLYVWKISNFFSFYRNKIHLNSIQSYNFSMSKLFSIVDLHRMHVM